MTKRTMPAYCLLILTLSTLSTVFAQSPGYVTNSNDTGMPDYGSFIASQIDSVNLANGGLSIRLPLISSKGRGFNYSHGYRYESKFWVVDRYLLPLPPQNPQVRFHWRPDLNSGMWQTTNNLGGRVEWVEQSYQCPDWPYPGNLVGVGVRSNWTFTAADGTKYQFPLRKSYIYPPGAQCFNSIASWPQSLVAQSSNGQMEMDISNDPGTSMASVKLRFKDGSRPGGDSDPFTFKDANGNWCCGTDGNWTLDDLGRRMYQERAISTNIFAIDYYDSEGTVRSQVVEKMQINLNPAFPTTGEAICGFDAFNWQSVNYTVLKKITLANGLSYTFSYDDPDNPGQTNPFGEITKITLPTGGYVKYKWATIAGRDDGPESPDAVITCSPALDARVLIERRVSEDGTPAGEKVWTYSYSGTSIGGSTTTVTDPLQNVEVHTFTSLAPQAPPVEIQVEYRNPSGTPLRRVTTEWAADAGPKTLEQPPSYPAGVYLWVRERNPRVVRTTTTLLDTNQVSKNETDYADCYSFAVGVQFFTDCRENPTQTRDYDYGTGAAGPLLRTTSLTYLHNSNGSYLNAHILDRVAQKTVSGWGNTSTTQFVYDTTPISGTTSVPYHDYAGYSAANAVRGNLTQVKRWSSLTSTWLTETNYYNDVGNVIQKTDPLGFNTLFAYADNYSDLVDRNSQGLVTQVTHPATGGVAHVEKKQYYWNTGLVAATCGQNFSGVCVNSLNPSPASPVPDYAKFTYDALARPLTVVRGDGGHTNFAYQETTFPVSLSAATAINSTQNIVHSAIIDGLGRVKQTQLNSDPEGADYTDITYDSLGRKATVSNPHRATPSSTDGITTYQYDALGRVTTVIPPDGTALSNNVATVYAGNGVTVTDQAGKQRRSFTDALGRLTEVREPATGGPFPATSAAGTVSVSGSPQSTTVNQPYWGCVLWDDTGYCIQQGWIDNWVTIYDSGQVSVSAGTCSKSVTYNFASTPASLAAALAGAINADGTCVVSASASGSVITLTSRASGASADYNMVASTGSDNPQDFSTPSFVTAQSGASLTGGHDVTNEAVTLYFYDALDNLTCVEQRGNAPTGTGCNAPSSSDATSPWRVRRFTYDSLSRLITAKNPESGTITYSYDADGNLRMKSSPKANQLVTGTDTTTVSYCYDELRRMLAKGYSNSPNPPQQCTGTSPWLPTPAATFTYDAGTNGRGHMTSLADQAGTGTYAYDGMGRISGESRMIFGAPNNAQISKSLSYEYNLDGSIWKLHYPSNAIITYTPSSLGTNSAGRVGSVIDSGNSINYVTGAGGPNTFATYAPDGSVTGFTDGYTANFAGITNTFSYNKRLQPINMSAVAPSLPPNNQTVFSLGYDFHLGSANNGNVYGITNYKDANRNQVFTYDALNRLISAQNAGTNCAAMTVSGKTEYWGNAYAYDAWGNLLQKTVTKCGAENLQVTADLHNWLHTGASPDYQYDAAGNMTSDPTDGVSLTYDQENRITGAAGYTYTYDADGNRVKKANGSTGTLYWYMTPGIVAESDLNGVTKSEYVFFAGERVARRDGVNGAGGVFYYFSDHLKTASVITDSAGTIKAESDYYPWGGELQFVNNDSNHYKFTGKERDTETGLDYFGARYYSNGLGRWVSADWSATPIPVPYADFGDPQSLTLYGYVRNLPTTRIDADGHCDAKGQNCSAWDHVAGAVGGLLNIVPETLNIPGEIFNSISGAFGGPQVELLPLIQADEHASQPGIDTGTAAQVAIPAAQAAAEARMAGVVIGEVRTAEAGVTANAAKGAAYEKAVVAETKATDAKVAEQLTLKTESGVKTRMDVVSQKPAGGVRLQEAKSTATASLTKGQKAAHPEIAKSGATVVGKGKPGYPGGTKIPPTKVEVVRPKDR